MIFYLISWHAAFPSIQVSSSLDCSTVYYQGPWWSDFSLPFQSHAWTYTSGPTELLKGLQRYHSHSHTPLLFWPFYQHVKIPTFPLKVTKTQYFMLCLTTYFYPFLEQFPFFCVFQLLCNAFITLYCSYIYSWIFSLKLTKLLWGEKPCHTYFHVFGTWHV